MIDEEWIYVTWALGFGTGWAASGALIFGVLTWLARKSRRAVREQDATRKPRHSTHPRPEEVG